MIKAGTVGIDNYGQCALLRHNLLQVLRTIHRETRTGGIAYHFRLKGTCATFFHYLSFLRLGIHQPQTCDEYQRRH